MSRQGFYLKIDKGSRLAIENLSRWVRTVSLMGGDYYILCDRDDVIQKVKDTLILPDTVTFLKSERELEEVVSIARSIIPEGGMLYAGFAHLTTFLHARDQSYDFFWNIDADDTQFCLPEGRIIKLLECAGRYAEENGMDCFSLDMHTSRTGGQHWSFGVTYTKNRRDWLPILRSHANDREYLEKKWGQRFNIDWYFTYIRSLKELKLETFYFENLKFIHHHFENIFTNLCIWGLMHWKNNEMRMPMLEAFSTEESKQGRYPIPQEVVKLELEIEDWEAQNAIFFQNDWGSYLENINFEYLIPEEVLRCRRRLYYEKYDLDGTVACWGYGDCFQKVLPMISRICPVPYVCDNDQRKWGEMYEGCKVISPEELTQNNVSFVVITVLNTNRIGEIGRQLVAYGITAYCHINEWLKVIV